MEPLEGGWFPPEALLRYITWTTHLWPKKFQAQQWCCLNGLVWLATIFLSPFYFYHVESYFLLLHSSSDKDKRIYRLKTQGYEEAVQLSQQFLRYIYTTHLPWVGSDTRSVCLAKYSRFEFWVFHFLNWSIVLIHPKKLWAGFQFGSLTQFPTMITLMPSLRIIISFGLVPN